MRGARSITGLMDSPTWLEVSFHSSTGRPPITGETGTAEMETVRAELEQHCYTLYWKSLPFIHAFTGYRINLGGPDITLKDTSGKAFQIAYEAKQYYLYPSSVWAA